MIIGNDIIVKLVKQEDLVEGISKREISMPEGAGIDIRLGKLYKISSSGKTLASEFDSESKRYYALKPGESVYCESFEQLNLPSYISAFFFAKKELLESGLSICASYIGPKSRCNASFVLRNGNSFPVKIELGSAVLRAVFLEVKSGVKQYKRPK